MGIGPVFEEKTEGTPHTAQSLMKKLGVKTLVEADLTDEDLYCADLSGAKMIGANMAWADLSGAKMIAANLRAAVLSDADLSDADLSGANLRLAVLSGADLSGAGLSGANMAWADLSGADLSGATVTALQLAAARNVEFATLPRASPWQTLRQPSRRQGRRRHNPRLILLRPSSARRSPELLPRLNKPNPVRCKKPGFKNRVLLWLVGIGARVFQKPILIF
jgi:hypothetical protein